MNTALERSRQTLCKTGYYYCVALLIGFIPLKWPMDENNHLFCGHGEQMFTVILCPVGRKKKKKRHLRPNTNSHVGLAWSEPWHLGLTLYITALVPQSFQVWGLAHQLSHLRRDLLTEIYYVRASFSHASWLRPFPIETNNPSAGLCFSCLFLWAPPSCQLLPRSVAMLWGIWGIEVSSGLAVSIGEPDLFWYSVKSKPSPLFVAWVCRPFFLHVGLLDCLASAFCQFRSFFWALSDCEPVESLPTPAPSWFCMLCLLHMALDFSGRMLRACGQGGKETQQQNFAFLGKILPWNGGLWVALLVLFPSPK